MGVNKILSIIKEEIEKADSLDVKKSMCIAYNDMIVQLKLHLEELSKMHIHMHIMDKRLEAPKEDRLLNEIKDLLHHVKYLAKECQHLIEEE